MLECVGFPTLGHTSFLGAVCEARERLSALFSEDTQETLCKYLALETPCAETALVTAPV